LRGQLVDSKDSLKMKISENPTKCRKPRVYPSTGQEGFNNLVSIHIQL
jgi:hypothetical protein